MIYGQIAVNLSTLMEECHKGMRRQQWRSRGLINMRLAWGITQRWVITNGPADDVFPSWSVPESYIEAFCTGNIDHFIRGQKSGRRAQRHLQCALASGRLAATYFDGERLKPVPSWAWAHDDRVVFAWREDRLPLDALLPEEWAKWSGERCFLDRRAFGEWIGAALPLLGEPSLQEIRPADDPPSLVTHRPLPDSPYVELSEALSWLAFGIALNSNDLWDVIQTGRLGGSVAVAEKRLADSVDRFADSVMAGHLRCVGKYAETYHHGEGLLTNPFDPIRLMDFRRFDIVSNGLCCGHGLNTRINGDLVDIFGGVGRKDMYRDVHVNRDDMIRCFPEQTKLAEPAPAEPALKPIAERTLSNWLTAIGERASEMSQRNCLPPHGSPTLVTTSHGR